MLNSRVRRFVLPKIAIERSMKRFVFYASVPLVLSQAVYSNPGINTKVNQEKEIYQGVNSIDVSKINPLRLLIDEYSFMSRPYSYFYFHNIDKLGFKTDDVLAGGNPVRLGSNKMYQSFFRDFRYGGGNVAKSLSEYHKSNGTLGFLVIKDGEIICEDYFHGAGRNSRFQSNSLAKTVFTSLFGAALRDGKIKSLDDTVDKYVPDLIGLPYGKCKISELLSMSAPVKFNEDYTDPKAEIQTYIKSVLTSEPSMMGIAKSTAADIPGFKYQTMSTQVLEMVLASATGQSVNQYLQRQIWTVMEKDAFFYRHENQKNIMVGGSFVGSLRDYGRLGLIALNKGVANGKEVLPKSWIDLATSPKALVPKEVGSDGDYLSKLGYGYGWWLMKGKAGDAFLGIGIYGQIIYVNPQRNLVITQSSAQPEPYSPLYMNDTLALIDSMAAGLGK